MPWSPWQPPFQALAYPLGAQPPRMGWANDWAVLNSRGFGVFTAEPDEAHHEAVWDQAAAGDLDIPPEHSTVVDSLRRLEAGWSDASSFEWTPTLPPGPMSTYEVQLIQSHIVYHDHPTLRGTAVNWRPQRPNMIDPALVIGEDFTRIPDTPPGIYMDWAAGEHAPTSGGRVTLQVRPAVNPGTPDGTYTVRVGTTSGGIGWQRGYAPLFSTVTLTVAGGLVTQVLWDGQVMSGPVAEAWTLQRTLDVLPLVPPAGGSSQVVMQPDFLDVPTLWAAGAFYGVTAGLTWDAAPMIQYPAWRYWIPDALVPPKLRQRQRDDLRQRQGQSRQRTIRQRGYY